MKKRVFGPALASILSLLGVFAASLHAAEPESTSPPLCFGFLVPPDEPDSVNLRLAAEIAAEVKVDSGAPPARIIVRGGIGQWGDDASEAARLALDDAVQALITPPDGTASHLVLQVAGRTALPVVSLCPDTSVIGSGIPWLVQIVPDTRCQATALMRELQSKPSSSTTWHALVPQQRPGREIARDLRTAAEAFPSISLTTTETPAHPKRAPDWVIRLARLQPPVVLLWLDAEPAAQFVSWLRQNGYSGILAGPERLRSDRFLRAAGSHAEGLIVPSTMTCATGNPSFDPFTLKHLARTGTPPPPLAGYTHDAVLLLRTLNSLQLRSNSGAPPSFEKLPPIHGMTGTMTFDATGRRQMNLTLSVCKEGQWTRMNSLR